MASVAGNACTPFRIGKKLFGHVLVQLEPSILLLTLALGALDVVRVLELMITRRLLQQFVDRWHRVEDGWIFVSHHLLVGVQQVTRLQLELCFPVGIDVPFLDERERVIIGQKDPRTSLQQARKVVSSPCCPAIAGGSAATYRRARSRMLVVFRCSRGRAAEVRGERAGGAGKSSGV